MLQASDAPPRSTEMDRWIAMTRASTCEERSKAADALAGVHNRKAVAAFLRHHHSQGLSPRLLSVDEMFHPSTYETFKL